MSCEFHMGRYEQITSYEQIMYEQNCILTIYGNYGVHIWKSRWLSGKSL